MAAKTNRINLVEKDYRGGDSTMCRGCAKNFVEVVLLNILSVRI